MALIQKRYSIFKINEEDDKLELFFDDTYISEWEALQELNKCNISIDFKFVILQTYKVLNIDNQELKFTID